MPAEDGKCIPNKTVNNESPLNAFARFYGNFINYLLPLNMDVITHNFIRANM